MIVKSVAGVLLFLCSFTNLLAVSDQFNINLTVTADTIAPSIPTGLSATAISSSQIDLSWTASTDDVAVTGYRVYRDANFIATTTSTTYSDIGLSASTLYTYTVSAVDAVFNQSAQSASSSATTLAGSASTGSNGGGGGRSQSSLPQIYNLSITPSQTGVRISWDTSVATVGTISWGETTSFESGKVTETIFSTKHSLALTNLSPGTTYQFFLQVVNAYGNTNSLQGVFTTLPLPEDTLNARNFTATAGEAAIFLKWINPQSIDFVEVRIVKSDSFYPADPEDGEVIYEGRGSGFEDLNVQIGTRYYYTLFTKNKRGEYSSGLLAVARIKLPGEVSEDEDPLGNLPQAPQVDPVIGALTFLDFDFIQNGKKINENGNVDQVTIDGSQNLTVSLSYQKVPEVLKSIAITLRHPKDTTKTFSFLLRVNKEKTAYSATIAPLGDSGTYGVYIAIVDYKNRGMKNIFGSLLASAGANLWKEHDAFLGILKIIEDNLFLLTILLILGILFIWSLKQVLESKKQPVSV